MNKKDKKKLLEILGYVDKKSKPEKTASLKGLGKAIKTGTLGASIGASIGLSKGYNAISQNPNMSEADKTRNTFMPTLANAGAGALIGGVGVPVVKKGASKAVKAVSGVGKIFKAAEFIDELVFIKQASAVDSIDKDKEDACNLEDNNKTVVTDTTSFDSENSMDAEPKLKEEQNQKTDTSDIGVRR